MASEYIGAAGGAGRSLLPTDLPDRIRLPFSIDLPGLRDDLARLGDGEWTKHYVPQHYSGDWSALALRAPAGATHPILRIAANPGTSEWEPTQWLDRSPNFKRLLSQLLCDLEAVRLMRLSPGSSIAEHCDERLDADLGHARLHIPIVSGPGVEFRLNGSPVDMAPGEAWYLRLSDPHSAANRGLSERVHLVIDALLNPWLFRLLREGVQKPF
jgi:hypothetical protein